MARSKRDELADDAVTFAIYPRAVAWLEELIGAITKSGKRAREGRRVFPVPVRTLSPGLKRRRRRWWQRQV